GHAGRDFPHAGLPDDFLELFSQRSGHGQTLMALLTPSPKLTGYCQVHPPLFRSILVSGSNFAQVRFSPSSTTQNLSFRPEGRRFGPSRSGGTVFHRTDFVR